MVCVWPEGHSQNDPPPQETTFDSFALYACKCEVRHTGYRVASSSKTLVAGRPHCRTRASCWKRLERENVHASVALADVWTVLERGLLLDRLKKARRRDPRRKDADLAVAHVTSLMRNLKLESALQPKDDPSLRWPPPEPT